ncbi:MAG: hypothetical protein IJD13_05465 [Oscillospiraceae bacterium]|nr:hypothetical protein [Oscillospiraceae bacterium]
MKMTCSALTFTAEAEATVYFQAKENSSVGFSADAPLLWRLTDCFDNLLAEGCSLIRSSSDRRFDAQVKISHTDFLIFLDRKAKTV